MMAGVMKLVEGVVQVRFLVRELLAASVVTTEIMLR